MVAAKSSTRSPDSAASGPAVASRPQVVQLEPLGFESRSFRGELEEAAEKVRMWLCKIAELGG